VQYREHARDRRVAQRTQPGRRLVSGLPVEPNIDTDMLAGIDAPKTPAAEVASRLLDGLAADQEDIFPDPNAEAMAELWSTDPKGLERALSGAAPG
jgi:hypothetical protein